MMLSIYFAWPGIYILKAAITLNRHIMDIIGNSNMDKAHS